MSSFKRLSIGLAIVNEQSEILVVQRPQDDMLWQMPEFPVEQETDLALAVNSAMDLLIPDCAFDHLSQHTDWIEQEIPDYVAKKDGLTGATSEDQKWFLIRLQSSPTPDQIGIDLYPKAQWVAIDTLITLIAPYKRVTHTTALEQFMPHIFPTHETELTDEFKSGSQSISKKTRQTSTF